MQDTKPPLNLIRYIKRTVCAICLSHGRRFVRHPVLLDQVMFHIPQFVKLNQADNICWECHTKLKKALEFHIQAKNAYTAMNNAMLGVMGSSISLRSLSTLKIENQVVHINIEPCGTSLDTVENQVNSEICNNDDAWDPLVTKTEKPFVKIEPGADEETPVNSSNNETQIDLNEVINMKINKIYTENASTSYKGLENSSLLQSAIMGTNRSLPSDTEIKIEISPENTIYKSETTDGDQTETVYSNDSDDSSLETDTIAYVDGNKHSSSKSTPVRKATATTQNLKIYDIDDEIISKRITENELHAVREMDRKDSVYLNANYRCDKCIFGFKEESSYTAHLEKHNESFGSEMCSICELRFRSTEALDSHRISHFVAYLCPLCEYRSAYPTSVEEHFRLNHPKTSPASPKCDICSFVACSEAELVSHKDIFHRSVVNRRKGCECPVCGIKLRSQYRLNSHLKYSHMDQLKKNPQLLPMGIRLGRYKIPTCQYCGKTFEFPAILKNHIRSIHEKRPKIECPVCKKKYSNANTVKYHLLEYHVPSVETEDGPRERHYCKQCDRFFKNRTNYNTHLKTTRIHATSFVECNECGRRFTEKTSLAGHIARVHLRLRTHACTDCGKSYYKKALLRRHILLKHRAEASPKRHLCSQCGKKFSYMRTLSSHLLTHTGVRPFHCPYCDYKAAQKSALVTHAKYKHKDQPPLKYQDITPHNHTET